jgi:hypothetical protein
MRITPALLAPVLVLVLSGCLRTAASVVTAPVRIASKGVDLATTSQSEADEKRGREIRRREEALGKMQRSYDKHRRQCQGGDQSACQESRSEYEQIQRLSPGVPYEPR